MEGIIIVFALFFLVRLCTLYISIRNEKRLKKEGAVEYGKKNSLLLAVVHVLYYFACLYEAYHAGIVFDFYSWIGVGMMIFSYVMLFIVIYQLREVWTVKLYVAPELRIVETTLFKYVRHPNYFLNILPELIGVAFLCNAWITLIIGFPLYCTVLATRIVQEERAMSSLFARKKK